MFMVIELGLQANISESYAINEIWKHQTCLSDELDGYTLI